MNSHEMIRETWRRFRPVFGRNEHPPRTHGRKPIREACMMCSHFLAFHMVSKALIPTLPHKTLGLCLANPHRVKTLYDTESFLLNCAWGFREKRQNAGGK